VIVSQLQRRLEKLVNTKAKDEKMTEHILKLSPYQQIVDDLAATAGIKPPRVKFYNGRNAFYSPFTHRIAISRGLVSKVSVDVLHTLLAHEVGHAQRRRALLSNIGGISFVPLGSWLVCCVLCLMAFQYLGRWPALAMMVLGLMATLVCVRKISPALEAAQLVEEFEADRFADSAAGYRGAMEHALRELSRIEDNGYLGRQAELRILQLRKEY
jgi:Zn-dependent protease with chaperone function